MSINPYNNVLAQVQQAFADFSNPHIDMKKMERDLQAADGAFSNYMADPDNSPEDTNRLTTVVHEMRDEAKNKIVAFVNNPQVPQEVKQAFYNLNLDIDQYVPH